MEMEAKLKQAHGNWVEGDRFFDREGELALFIQLVQEGANLLLLAQRRMGKTSLMHEVARRLGGQYVCLFVDLQKASSPPDAIAEISTVLQPDRQLWEKARDVFSNVLSRIPDVVETVDVGQLAVTLRSGIDLGNWAAKGDQLLDVLAKSDRPVLILLDEVPIMINRLLKGSGGAVTPEGRETTDQFMSWLRSVSIRHQGQVRMVISGSIGLEPILHQANLSSTLNTFRSFELKPWDECVAIECLRALANEYSIQFVDEAEVQMVKLLGCCIPHHVQMFFAQVHDWCQRGSRTDVPVEEIQGIYDQQMLGIRGHAELTHYEERLELVLDKEAFPLALDMLTEAAVSGVLCQDALLAFQKEYATTEGSTLEIQRQILGVLEHDGYLTRGQHGYVFVSALLRDWWKRRYEELYVPISGRREGGR